jgi:hypothetical protein
MSVEPDRVEYMYDRWIQPGIEGLIDNTRKVACSGSTRQEYQKPSKSLNAHRKSDADGCRVGLGRRWRDSKGEHKGTRGAASTPSSRLPTGAPTCGSKCQQSNRMRSRSQALHVRPHEPSPNCPNVRPHIVRVDGEGRHFQDQPTNQPKYTIHWAPLQGGDHIDWRGRCVCHSSRPYPSRRSRQALGQLELAWGRSGVVSTTTGWLGLWENCTTNFKK